MLVEIEEQRLISSFWDFSGFTTEECLFLLITIFDCVEMLQCASGCAWRYYEASFILYYFENSFVGTRLLFGSVVNL